MLGIKASNGSRKRTRSNFRQIVRMQGKSKLAMKLTGPGRIRFLSSIFPKARFIHVIRDGRAVVASLSRVKFWRDGGGQNKLWWTHGISAAEASHLSKYSNDSLLLAASQWMSVLNNTRLEASQLSADRYMEIKYEDFFRNPTRSLESVCSFSGLQPTETMRLAVHSLNKEGNMNYKARERLKEKAYTRLTEFLSKDLVSLGYTADMA